VRKTKKGRIKSVGTTHGLPQRLLATTKQTVNKKSGTKEKPKEPPSRLKKPFFKAGERDPKAKHYIRRKQGEELMGEKKWGVCGNRLRFESWVGGNRPSGPMLLLNRGGGEGGDGMGRTRKSNRKNVAGRSLKGDG